jgi:hypothetical protein
MAGCIQGQSSWKWRWLMDKLTHDETLLLLDALSSVLPHNFSSAQMQKRAERKLKRWLDHKDIEFA